jgi:hypothetical protein
MLQNVFGYFYFCTYPSLSSDKQEQKSTHCLIQFPTVFAVVQCTLQDEPRSLTEECRRDCFISPLQLTGWGLYQQVSSMIKHVGSGGEESGRGGGRSVLRGFLHTLAYFFF